MTEKEKSRRGLVGRWRQLAPAGQRRIGEFVGNMFLGAAASAATFVVIPALTGKGDNALPAVILGVAITVTFAIFAVLVRLLTEERKEDSAKETKP